MKNSVGFVWRVLTKSTKKIISGLYNGLHEDINTDKIAERLNSNIDKSLEGRKIDSKTREQINVFVNQITTQYKKIMGMLILKKYWKI